MLCVWRKTLIVDTLKTSRKALLASNAVRSSVIKIFKMFRDSQYILRPESKDVTRTFVNRALLENKYQTFSCTRCSAAG